MGAGIDGSSMEPGGAAAVSALGPVLSSPALGVPRPQPPPAGGAPPPKAERHATAAQAREAALAELHAATLQLKHPISGFPALMLRAPLPDEWKQHAPQAMRVAAERALTVPLGEGPLWDEQPEET